MGGIKLRYWVYGGLLLGLGVGYFVFDEAQAPEQTQRDGRIAYSAEELPMLHVPVTGGEAKVRRDIFAFVAHEAPPVVKPAEVAPEEPPPAKVTDRFADLQVLGVVSQKGRQALLIRIGEQVFTIVQGQRFGEDDALDVSSVDGRQVSVDDTISGISKTFLLSEE